MRTGLLLLLLALAALPLSTGCNKTPDAAAADGAVAPANAPAGPPPAIACDEPNYDFGTVADGEPVKHTFTVKNTGQGVLKLLRAQGG